MATGRDGTRLFSLPPAIATGVALGLVIVFLVPVRLPSASSAMAVVDPQAAQPMPTIIVPPETADEAALAWLADPDSSARLGVPLRLVRASTKDRGSAPPSGIPLVDRANRDMNNFVCPGLKADRLPGDLIPFTYDLPACPEPWVEGFVFARLEGSGTLVRLWMTLLSAAAALPEREILRIYIDDEPTPLVQVPLGAAMDGSAGEIFAPPFGAGVHTRLAWYYPVVFTTRLVLTIDRLGPFDLFYAQADAAIDTAPRARRRSPTRLALRDAAASQLRPQLVFGNLTEATIHLEPEVPVIVADLSGPTTIDAIAFDPGPSRLADVRLQVDWDGIPGIDATLADLFAAWDDPPPGPPFTLRLPMPFATSSRWSLTAAAPTDVRVMVDGRPGIGSDVGRLHVERAETRGPTDRLDHAFLDIARPARLAAACFSLAGHGEVAGIAASAFNFLEGDERLVVNEDNTLTVRGTGTEDYFDSAFYFGDGAFATPFAAAWGIAQDSNHGHVNACRFHREVPVEGTSGLQGFLEIGPARPDFLDQYRSVAFYYTLPN